MIDKSTKVRTFLLFLVVVGLIGGMYWLLESQKQKSVNTHDLLALQDHYSTKVQPVFDKKCIACHSCFNSPCQLNLTSFQGVQRGANKTNIYDYPKINARKPTRLYIDGHSEEEWRDLDFFSVLDNKPQSLLTYMITQPPGIESGLQNKYDAEYSRQCITSTEESELKKFFKLNPAGRMPLGFPPLKDNEISHIAGWVASGAKGPEIADQEAKVLKHLNEDKRVETWESFFNGETLKERITARYLYEHLFLADLYFDDKPHIFFRLVRSKTKTGAIEEVGTSFPFDDPGSEFTYRLRPVTQTLVHKSHIPFGLTDRMLKEWGDRFVRAPWPQEPKEFPVYGKQAGNPFEVFKMMPVKARYQLFLENSLYFIMTFIKGPVCRGQTALNVINDHFWVFFLDPSMDPLVQSQEAYGKVAEQTHFPSEIGDDFSPFADFKDKYWNAVKTKFSYLEKGKPLGLKSLWNGRGKNPNANITVYRHFDSANVLYGLRGQKPKTVWVLDYQVFESIYYNLSAGYNVFGPLLHQLNSRLYMEVSRVASEDLFLSFLPKDSRAEIRSSWNVPTPNRKETLLQDLVDLFSKDAKEKLMRVYQFQGDKVKSTVKLASKNVKAEFLGKLKNKMFSPWQVKTNLDSESPLIDFPRLPSEVVRHLPDTMLFVVESEEKQTTELWTAIHNKAHFNVAMILFENQRRNPQDDSLDVVKGAATSYANLIISIKESQLKNMFLELKDSKDAADVSSALKKYALSRGNPKFWEIFEQASELTYNPETNERGWLDLNRYINL